MIRVGDLQSTPAEWTVKSLVSGRQGPKQAASEEPVPPPIQNGYSGHAESYGRHQSVTPVAAES